MHLLLKVNLSLAAVFCAGLTVTGLISKNVLQENAKREVMSHASLMMEAALAARSYTSAEIKPLLEARLHKEFLPQTVPSTDIWRWSR